MLSLHSTDAIPPQYWCCPSTVLMLSLHSTDAILCSTDAIPQQYWCYPPAVLNSLRSTDASLCNTYAISRQYWTASAVLNRRYTGWLYYLFFFLISLTTNFLPSGDSQGMLLIVQRISACMFAFLAELKSYKYYFLDVWRDLNFLGQQCSLNSIINCYFINSECWIYTPNF